MAYTPINNTQVDPDSPVTADLMTSLRDNPLAIAAGEAGAPRVQDAALSVTVTAAGRDWVAARTAALGASVVGSHAFLDVTLSFTGAVAFGDSIAGSNLQAANGDGGFGSAMSGTWRCLGYAAASGGSGGSRATLFLRIS